MSTEACSLSKGKLSYILILFQLSGLAIFVAGFLLGTLYERQWSRINTVDPLPPVIIPNFRPQYLPPNPEDLLPKKAPPEEKLPLLRTSSVDWNKERECLAKNIYFEARDQSQKGQIAVALVTVNRTLSKKYPNTICGVVWQKKRSKKTGKYVAQFSWTLDGKKDDPMNKELWESAQVLASAMIDEGMITLFADFTQGATHYHADYVAPSWRKAFTRVLVEGNHIFYRDEKATPITVAMLGDNRG